MISKFVFLIVFALKTVDVTPLAANPDPLSCYSFGPLNYPSVNLNWETSAPECMRFDINFQNL